MSLTVVKAACHAHNQELYALRPEKRNSGRLWRGIIQLQQLHLPDSHSFYGDSTQLSAFGQVYCVSIKQGQNQGSEGRDLHHLSGQRAVHGDALKEI